MSRQYYVRDRGRTMGPFSREQLFDMRDRGQIQAYHEVSTDQRSWKAFDLQFAEPDRPPTAPPPPTRGGRPGGGGTNRTFKIVIASVVAVLILSAIAIGGYFIVQGIRSHGADADHAGRVPEGPIALSPNTSTRERDDAVADTVALVVPGIYVKYNDGSWAEDRLGHGSGFAVSANGHIITNRHVVEEIHNFKGSQLRLDRERELGGSIDAKIWVFFGQDRKFEAEVLHVSVDYDLAILKVNRSTPRYFAMCRTDDTRIPMLDSVASLGFPSTDQKAMKIMNPNQPVTAAKGAPVQRGFLDADFKVTKENGGIKKNSFRARPDPSQLEAYYLVHTARIATGNSGGPLIARDGTVLGINTLGITVTMGKEKMIQEGQNYALTLPQLRKEIDHHVPGAVWREAPE